MNVSTMDVADASRLINFALDVRALPGTNEDYADLLRRYRLDAALQETVDAVCVGLHLRVVVAEDQGLLLAPEVPSIFSLGTVQDFEPGLTPEMRMLTGLILLCVAAVAYPNPVDLERNAIVRVRVSKVERALRETARVVAERVGDTDDEVPRAFRVLDTIPTSRPGAKRHTKSTSLGAIKNALDRLVEFGCAREVTTRDDDPEFQLLDRFRHYVRERAVSAMNEALRETMSSAAAEPGSPSSIPIVTAGVVVATPNSATSDDGPATQGDHQ